MAGVVFARSPGMTGGNKWRNIASRRTGHIQINSIYSFLPVQVVKQNLVRVRFLTGDPVPSVYGL